MVRVKTGLELLSDYSNFISVAFVKWVITSSNIADRGQEAQVLHIMINATQ